MATATPSPLTSSVEKTNGAKLNRLLMDGGTTVLRSVFDRHHPPANLAADLNANRVTLKNLLCRRILNRHQWDKLFPPGGAVPDSNTFDITLLFVLLTTICGLSPPPSGWHKMPPSSDTSLEANLARVKWYRNELYGHVTTTGIKTAIFNGKWQGISEVLVSLGLSQSEVDRLKAEPCGDDYVRAVTQWMKSDEEIKSQLKELRENQEEVVQIQQQQHSILQSTQQAVEEVLHTQQEDHRTLQDAHQTVKEMRQTAQLALEEVLQKQEEAQQMQHDDHNILQDTQLKGVEEIKEAHKESISKLDVVCQSQAKTCQAVEEVRKSIQEFKQELELKREMDREDEVLKNLVKSEFKGDIEHHTKKFQEGTREWIFESIVNWLDDRASQNRVMVISGNAGIGKTVISAVISQRMQEAGRLSGSHFCQHNNARYRNPQLMLQSLACHLSNSIPEYKRALVEKLSRNQGNKDLNNMGVEELFALLFKEPLSKLDDPGRNFLIVIDGLDESEYQGRNELLDVIGNHFCKLPDWIRFFVTTRPERNIVEALKHLKPKELEQNQEENLKDIQILFEKQLSRVIGEEFKDVLLKELVKTSEGLFLYAYFLIDFIKNNVSFLTPEKLENSLPLGISSVYLSYFKRLEKELRNELKVEEEDVLRFLCALTASREILPIEFVCKILNPGGRTLTSQRRVKKAVACISALLPVCDGCLHFFHKSVKDWLTDRSCYGEHDFTVDEKEGHEILFNLCISELDAIKEKGVYDTQFNNFERYALQHGVQHMFEADKSRAFNVTENLIDQYVADLELIYAKLCVNSTVASEDILSALKQVKPALLNDQSYSTLISLLRLLRKHSYVLRDHPHLFFQSLLNDEDPELSSKAAKILQMQLPNVPYVEYVDKEDHKTADEARFYCSDTVACFDVSPGLDYLVCECRDGTIHLWSLQTGNREWVLPSLMKRDFYQSEPFGSAYRQIKNCLSFYRSVVFHPSGKSVLPGTLQHVYTLSGERKILFPESDCTFSNCAFPADKTFILTDCLHDPKRIAFWDMENGGKLHDILWIEEIASFTINQGGSVIAISDLTGRIVITDTTISRCYGLNVTDAVCGLLHFTSNDSTLVCGFLLLTAEEQYDGIYKFVFSEKPGFMFLTPPKDNSQLRPVRKQNFVLWPSETKDVTEHNFIEQTLSSCWVNKVQRVFPSLSAGSYIRLSDETVLIGSPTHTYVTTVNVGLLNTMTDPDSTKGKVRSVVFSLEGDRIYSSTFTPDADDSLGELLDSPMETEVTVWKMSSRETMKKRSFSGIVSLIPSKEGVIIVNKHNVAKLWNFELSEIIRILPKLEVAEFTELHAISGELIACWDLQRSLCGKLLVDSTEISVPTELSDSAEIDGTSELNVSAELEDSPPGLKFSTELSDSTKLDDSAELKDSIELLDSAELADSPKLRDSTELSDSTKLDDSPELKVSTELPDSAELAYSPELKVLTELSDSAKLDDSPEMNVWTQLRDAAVSTELPDSAELDDSPPELKFSTELSDSTMPDDSPELKVSTELPDSAELAVSPELRDSTELSDSTKLGDSPELNVWTQLRDSAVSTELPDSADLRDSPEVQVSTELLYSAKVDDSPEMKVSTELLDSAKLDDSPEMKDATELLDSAKLDDSPEMKDATELLDSGKLYDSPEIRDSTELLDSAGLVDSLKLNASTEFAYTADFLEPFLSSSSPIIINCDFLNQFLHPGWILRFRRPVVVDFFNVSTGEFESSVRTTADHNEAGILFLSCNSRRQLLICTCDEIDNDNYEEEHEIAISLRDNSSVIWKRNSQWFPIEDEWHQAVRFSPQDEFVVTWNILDSGRGLHVLDAKTGKTLNIFFKKQKDIVNCKFVDTESLVCYRGDTFLRLLNVKTGHLLSLLDVGEQPYCFGTCLHSPVVAVGLKNAKLKFIRLRLPADSQNKKG